MTFSCTWTASNDHSDRQPVNSWHYNSSTAERAACTAHSITDADCSPSTVSVQSTFTPVQPIHLPHLLPLLVSCGLSRTVLSSRLGVQYVRNVSTSFFQQAGYILNRNFSPYIRQCPVQAIFIFAHPGVSCHLRPMLLHQHCCIIQDAVPCKDGPSWVTKTNCKYLDLFPRQIIDLQHPTATS